MSNKEALNLKKIAEALIYASKTNPCSHGAELDLVERLKSNNSLLEARLRRTQNVLKQLKVGPNGIIVDLGCGNALNSVLCLMCGIGEVHSIEVEDKRFHTAQIVVDYLDIGNRIHLYQANILDLDLPHNSIDGAFSAELLEHISDLSGLYKKLKDWLKTGGVVYARTGANGKNFRKHKTFRKEWDALDVDYEKQRLDIIRRKATHLNIDVASDIARRTRGLMSEEVEKEVDEWLHNGKLVIDRRPCAPRDPYTGEYMERLLDPFLVAKQIDNEGFKTNVLRPDFSSLTMETPFERHMYWFLGQLIRLTHPLSLCMAPWLELRSVKI